MQYIIRPTEMEDARGIHALRHMPGVFENILGTPSERLDRSEKMVAGMDDNAHSFVAVATDADGGQLVIGLIGLSVYGNHRMRHMAGIGMMVHRDYQGHGVGTALLAAALDMADNWLKLVRVDLEVYVDNDRAIHMYKKQGFVEEGVKRMAAIRAGQYVDVLMMGRINQD